MTHSINYLAKDRVVCFVLFQALEAFAHSALIKTPEIGGGGVGCATALVLQESVEAKSKRSLKTTALAWLHQRK